MKIIKKFLTGEESETISSFIMETENYVKSIGPDNYIGTGDDSLTGRYWCYNYLYAVSYTHLTLPTIYSV